MPSARPLADVPPPRPRPACRRLLKNLKDTVHGKVADDLITKDRLPSIEDLRTRAGSTAID